VTTPYDDFLDAPSLLPKDQVPSLEETWRPSATWTGFDDSKLVVELDVADLGLSEVEQQFIEALAGPRVKQGAMRLVVRVDGGYEAHRAKMSSVLEQLIEESKKLAVAHPNGPEKA